MFEAITAERAEKLASALRTYACLFPQRSDVEKARRGVAIDAGRFNSVLVADGEGRWCFRV